MYLTNKDRKIQTQQNIINRLEEENKCLKEQLEACSEKKMSEKIKLAEQTYQEYKAMLEEVSEMRDGYVELIEELSEMKEEMKKGCR